MPFYPVNTAQPSFVAFIQRGHRRGSQAGFTLIELMIALVLATAISAGLVVAFRLGLQYVERGQRFYSTLQESFAVTNLLRRELHTEALTSIRGDETSLQFTSKAVPDGRGRPSARDVMLRCVAGETQPVSLRLEQLPMLPAEKPEAGKEAPPREGDETRKTVLLDRLTSCGFEFLVREPAENAAKDGAAAPVAGTPPPAPGAPTPATPAPSEPPPPSKAAWQNGWDKAGKPLALRLRFSTEDYSLPPIVFPLGK